MVRRTHAALARAVSGTGRTLEVHVAPPVHGEYLVVTRCLQPHIPPLSLVGRGATLERACRVSE